MKSNKQMHVESLITRKVTLSEFTYEMSKLGVTVVQPGMDVSAVWYRDERRFFPTLDDEYCVVGGYFG